MKKHPLKILGTVFASIAAVELAALIILLAIPAVRHSDEALIVLPSVLGIQTLVFGGIGAGFLTHVRKKEKLREELKAGGYTKTAAVVEVERVYSVHINGRCPYRVVCRIEEGSVLHEYRSDMLRSDPGLLPGDPVTIYLDWRDDSRYYVDVESASPTIIRH